MFPGSGKILFPYLKRKRTFFFFPPGNFCVQIQSSLFPRLIDVSRKELVIHPWNFRPEGAPLIFSSPPSDLITPEDVVFFSAKARRWAFLSGAPTAFFSPPRRTASIFPPCVQSRLPFFSDNGKLYCSRCIRLPPPSRFRADPPSFPPCEEQ